MFWQQQSHLENMEQPVTLDAMVVCVILELFIASRSLFCLQSVLLTFYTNHFRTVFLCVYHTAYLTTYRFHTCICGKHEHDYCLFTEQQYKNPPQRSLCKWIWPWSIGPLNTIPSEIAPHDKWQQVHNSPQLCRPAVQSVPKWGQLYFW